MRNSRIHNSMKKPIILLALPVIASLFAGCADDRSELEKAADKVSDAVEEVGEELKEAGEEIKDAVKKSQ